MTEPVPAVRSVAAVPTPHAGRYLTQLCKHFQHRVPVTLDAETGQIAFQTGICRGRAAEDTLTLSLEAADLPNLEQLQDVVARHLLRFAFRESLTVAWRTA